ncbi:hypothetical protein H8M03_05060 [Sphingomonas sabuli]|uniref:Uncharacterized protein n=1 Tax=Sphingomonas sabuli TaxID=2764186 RepID=A0A7G9L4Z4_9SPHN|nr:hypothetical protein [Sphingomonas sabuli]QNM83693.1 hypothetical protein H8M03_05060 [Sphingomonas sabuli]
MTDQLPSKRDPLFADFAFLGNMGFFLFPAGIVVLMIVPVVLVWQLLEWMEKGRWPAMSTADGLHYVGLAEPHFQNRTIEDLSATVLAAPLTLVVLIFVGGFLYLYALFSKWLERHCEPDKANRARRFR